MGFIKFQKVEKTELVSLEDHDAISDGLHKVGKTSIRQMSDEERKRLLEEISRLNMDNGE
jgi:hypothetical protein